MSKVLIVGGAGYVGCVLVPKILERDFEVRVLDAMFFGSEGLHSVQDKCEIIKGDIRDPECLKKSLENVESVIHLAAISNDSCGELNPKLTIQVNFEATKNLVKLAKEKGIRRFVYASSNSVYGIKHEPDVTEDISLAPLTIYAKTKAWSEEYILDEASASFNPVCIRSATVCGCSPRQRLDVVVNIFTSNAVTKGRIYVNGGDQKRPNIHIDDITDYYADLLHQPNETIRGQIFNAGGENYRLMELAEIVRDNVGEHVEIIKLPERPSSRSYHISSVKIKRILGFTPKKTVKDAIIELKKAFKQGLIPDPESPKYININRMKEIGLENLI